MEDLPTLSEGAQRILELRWRDLIRSCRLTGDHVARYARADEATRRLALSRPPEVKGNIDWWLIQHDKARNQCGIYWCERLATSWFDDLAHQYWKAWSPALLEFVRKKVQEDVASAWKGANQWYQAVCKPAVEAAISRRAGEFEGRNEELLALIRDEMDAKPGEPAPEERPQQMLKEGPAADPFAAKKEREAAIKRAAERLGTVAKVATSLNVDYHDLRKWARERFLAKGPSEKVARIERELLKDRPK
jgi:hypothetical protein